MNFDLLPLRAKRAAFAKMSAADKAKKGGKKPRKAPVKKAAAKKATPNPSRQVSDQYVQTGKPTAQDVETLISNYRLMFGRDPSPAQLAKLRRKRR